MTGPRFASFTAPSSYWQASRAPRYSLLFALPLLVFYQVLAVWLAAGPRSVRNGADVILQSLFTALAAAARTLLGWTPFTAGIAATVLGAAIFSAFHYIGPYGDRLQIYSFVFRMIAGLFFSALYLLRGFGITAWTHALYDVSLLLLQ